MARILTIECYGDLPAGWVPYISGPLLELGDGKAEDAPMLVPIGPQQWELQVAVTGIAVDSCLTSCVPGMRPLQFPDFNRGRGCLPLPSGVRWTYTLGPVLHPAATDVYYYSGWQSVRLRVIDGQDVRDFPLAGVGPGRTRAETLWHVCLPTEDFTRHWGFLLLGPHDEVDRLPDGTLYRPLASRVYLADGEIFPHVLPNTMPPVIVYASTVVGLLVVFSAGLSFLGLGVSPPIPDWGVMVSDGRTVLGVAPHVATVPGLMISMTSLCFNLVGDGLRFALDPRTRNIG